MRVGFNDPQGPKVWRTVPYALPFLVLFFAIFGPISGVPASLLGVSSVALFNGLGLFRFRQKKARTAEIEFGPGYLDIKKVGSRNQRILAKEISGATTARTRTGLLLTLQHTKRDQPITVEVATEAEADKVRTALGIGHSGFGTIAWRTQTDNSTRAAFVGRVLATLIALLTIIITLTVSNEAGFFTGLLLGQFGLVGAILGLINLLGRPTDPTVVMAAEGLRLKTPLGWFALPYDSVQNVDDHKRGLVFYVPAPYHTVAVERVGPTLGGPSEAERKTLIAQVMAAALRARGMGPSKNDVSGRIDVLRRNGESPRSWLTRLDMAGQMLSTGTGYRGNTLETDDLWTILEDPEADADLRAAAARVLRHSPKPETRPRIDAALAAVRDEPTNRRLRIAIQDDLDNASQELAFLDATEPRQQQQQQRQQQQVFHPPAPPMQGGRF